MRAAAAQLVGEHDFSAFQAAGCEAKQPVRRVVGSELHSSKLHGSKLQRADPLITYRIEATGFLRYMVRNIIGTMVEVGFGERSATDVAHLLGRRDRALAGPTAPACGLCLTRVNY
jgi:tRNA pseudouridine38-40 synthase